MASRCCKTLSVAQRTGIMAGMQGPELARALTLVMACGVLNGCEKDTIVVVTGLTGIDVIVSYDPGLGLDQVAISGELAGGNVAFAPGELPSSPAPMTNGTDNFVVLLRDSLAGESLFLWIDGLSDGEVVASEGALLVVEEGRLVTVSLELGAPAMCGDGVVRAPREQCDDGRKDNADGCDDECRIEPGFFCGGAPSQCRDDTVSVRVDAATCTGSGDGSPGAPFCTIAEGVADNAEVIFVAPGTYDQVAVTNNAVVEIIGDPGTIVRSTNPASARALRVATGADVQVIGVTFTAGGVRVEGAGSTLALRQCTVGPSTSIGVEAETGGSLTVERTLVAGNTSGGIHHSGAGTIEVTNSLVIENTGFGGVWIEDFAAGSAFVNNTIADNQAASHAGGVQCDTSAALVNLVVWNNTGTETSGLTSSCAPTHSSLQTAVTGTGNLPGDPSFVLGDYRLSNTSPCVDAGDDAVSPLVDFDGVTRPRGAGVDMGAFERP
jgi:cysteine-rich repeat protein